jgi:hypothetical protein
VVAFAAVLVCAGLSLSGLGLRLIWAVRICTRGLLTAAVTSDHPLGPLRLQGAIRSEDTVGRGV